MEQRAWVGRIPDNFKTLGHSKATMEYHRTKDIPHVMSLLGHKNIRNTLVYTHLVKFENDEWICRVAKQGTEYVVCVRTSLPKHKFTSLVVIGEQQVYADCSRVREVDMLFNVSGPVSRHEIDNGSHSPVFLGESLCVDCQSCHGAE